MRQYILYLPLVYSTARMNAHIVDILILAIVFAIYLVLHRLYKRIERRCTDKGCGSLNVKRIHFIFLPTKEKDLSFSFIDRDAQLPEKIISWRHPIQTFRWFALVRIFRGIPRYFIRRSVRVTLTDCRGNKEGHRLIKLELLNFGPLTLVNARKNKRLHPEQYEMPAMEYKIAIYNGVRAVYLEKPISLAENETDTPDLVEAFFNDLQEKVNRGLELFGDDFH